MSVGTGLVAGSALVAFVAAATALVWTSETARPAPVRAVAYVNGTPITSDDLDVRLSQILPLASYHGNLPPERIASLKRAALDELVLDELIGREATTAGRQPSPAAVDADVAAARARFDSDDAFSAALKANNLTLAAFRDRLGRAVLVREAREAHERVVVSDADVAAYYRENGAKFQRPEQVHLRQILFRVDPADPTTAVPAEAKAQATLKSIRQGEPFGAIARRLSEDEYRVKDGDMGFVHRGRLDAAFEDAVFTAPVGQPAVARSLHGFEVFEVLERQPAVQLTLDEARSVIVERLTRQRRSESFQAWNARLRSDARIEIRDADLAAAQPAEIAEEGGVPAIGGVRRRSMAGGGR